MKMYVVPCLNVYHFTNVGKMVCESTVDVTFTVGADASWDGKEERVELVREEKWGGGW